MEKTKTNIHQPKAYKRNSRFQTGSLFSLHQLSVPGSANFLQLLVLHSTCYMIQTTIFYKLISNSSAFELPLASILSSASTYQ